MNQNMMLSYDFISFHNYKYEKYPNIILDLKK